MPSSRSLRASLSRLPTPSLPRPSTPSLPTPPVSLPRPSAPTPRALLARLRPSGDAVDLALACGALGTGFGVALAAAYTAADAVLPLALLSELLSGVAERLTP